MWQCAEYDQGCRGRFKPAKFEALREEEDTALEAELGPLASEHLRYSKPCEWQIFSPCCGTLEPGRTR